MAPTERIPPLVRRARRAFFAGLRRTFFAGLRRTSFAGLRRTFFAVFLVRARLVAMARG
jgi:hypothetical protein